MAVSLTALVFAMGGTGYAATQASTTLQPAATPIAKTSAVNRGPRGFRGLRGYRGPAGPGGRTGPTGLTGLTGPAGAPGPAGAAGPVGPAGTALAFAHFAATGVIDRARTVVQANVTHPKAGTYCLAGLATAPNNAIATIDAATLAGSATIATAIAPAPGDCPAATQVLVKTDGADRSFFLLLN